MEEVVKFKNKLGYNLYGILHIPEPNKENKRNNSVGINLLNPGLKNRVAPNRLNVKIARKLCDMGFYVLRFDPYGIGDSEGHLLNGENESVMDLWGFIQKGALVSDTIIANTFLWNRANLDKLILIGQCGAGVTAGIAGSKDDRVNGMIIIDTPFRIVSSNISISNALIESYSPKQLLIEQIKDVIELRWISKLVNNEIDAKWIKQKIDVLKRIVKRDNMRGGIKVSERFNWELAKSLKSFLDAEKDIYLLFAQNDFSLSEFKSDFQPNFLLNRKDKKNCYKVDIINDANHIYTEIKWQKNLINRITRWLDSSDCIHG